MFLDYNVNVTLECCWTCLYLTDLCYIPYSGIYLFILLTNDTLLSSYTSLLQSYHIAVNEIEFAETKYLLWIIVHWTFTFATLSIWRQTNQWITFNRFHWVLYGLQDSCILLKKVLFLRSFLYPAPGAWLLVPEKLLVCGFLLHWWFKYLLGMIWIQKRDTSPINLLLVFHSDFLMFSN